MEAQDGLGPAQNKQGQSSTEFQSSPRAVTAARARQAQGPSNARQHPLGHLCHHLVALLGQQRLVLVSLHQVHGDVLAGAVPVQALDGRRVDNLQQQRSSSSCTAGPPHSRAWTRRHKGSDGWARARLVVRVVRDPHRQAQPVLVLCNPPPGVLEHPAQAAWLSTTNKPGVEARRHSAARGRTSSRTSTGAMHNRPAGAARATTTATRQRGPRPPTATSPSGDKEISCRRTCQR